MANDKYYAWSNINTGDVTINVGKEVSQADLDIDDDAWQALVDGGSVRTTKYPETGGTSPNEYYREQLAKLATGEVQPDELKELQAAGLTGDEEVNVPEQPATPAKEASSGSK